MWIIIIAIVIMVLIQVLNVFLHIGDIEDIIMFGLFYFLVIGSLLFIIVFITISMTTGLCENFGHGSQAGYITSIEKSGIIWKTWEGRIQEGVGEQVNVGGILKFSVTDDKVVKELQKISGSKQRVNLIYNSWLIIPYQLGATNCLVTQIDILQ